MTLREWQERAERERVERANKFALYDREATHEKLVNNALANGIRNLTAKDYRAARRLAGKGDMVRWPLDAPIMFNGSGTPCDMWSGPCSCGAWHREGI